MTQHTISPTDSRTIEWMRFPLIVFVVFIHSLGSGYDFHTIDWSLSSSADVFNVLRCTMSRVLTHIAVPCFYVISGYLLFFNMDNWGFESWKKKFASRVHTLLIPYIIWNALFIVVSAPVVKALLCIEPWDSVGNWLIEGGGQRYKIVLGL